MAGADNYPFNTVLAEFVLHRLRFEPREKAQKNVEVFRVSPLAVYPAGRVVKRPKQEDCERLHEATIQLLEQQQDLCSLFREVGVSEQQQPTNSHIRTLLIRGVLHCARPVTAR